jgi:hypothetical protein
MHNGRVGGAGAQDLPGQVLAVVLQLLLFPAFGMNAGIVHLLQSGTWFVLAGVRWRGLAHLSRTLKGSFQ